jgi:hypothetical protein
MLIEPSSMSRVLSEPSLMSADVIEPFLMSAPSISVLAAKAEPVVENSCLSIRRHSVEALMLASGLSSYARRAR